MSIAVAATIKPSRTLTILMHAMCAMVCFVGVFLLCQGSSQLSFGVRLAVSLACLSGTVIALWSWCGKRSSYRVEVDVDGHVYLQQLEVGKGDVVQRGRLVELQPSSTLWPGVMVLRFRMIEGTRPTTSLTIFRDSLSRQEFRALSASLRWVAVHRNRQDAVSAGAASLQ